MLGKKWHKRETNEPKKKLYNYRFELEVLVSSHDIYLSKRLSSNLLIKKAKGEKKQQWNGKGQWRSPGSGCGFQIPFTNEKPQIHRQVLSPGVEQEI